VPGCCCSERGRLRNLPDPFIDLGGIERLQGSSRADSSRAIACICPSARTIGVVSLTITRWPSSACPGASSGPTIYITRGHVTLSLFGKRGAAHYAVNRDARLSWEVSRHLASAQSGRCMSSNGRFDSPMLDSADEYRTGRSGCSCALGDEQISRALAPARLGRWRLALVGHRKIRALALPISVPGTVDRILGTSSRLLGRAASARRPARGARRPASGTPGPRPRTHIASGYARR
jgi:hypothetical protein